MEKNTHDFQVALQAIYTKTEGSAEKKNIVNRRAVVRQDTGAVLGILSDNYTLLSHADVINNFRKALGAYDYEERIQVAKGGAHLFATYKLNAIKVEVRKDDIVSLQFVVKNSYDGSSTLQIMLGAYRLVCSNGMIVGKSFFNFSQKHVGGSNDIKIETIQEKIGNLIGQFQNVLPKLQEMSRTDMVYDPQDLTPAVLDGFFSKEKIKGMPAYLLEIAKAEFIRAEDWTLWGYYNALTFAITHSMKRESPVSMLKYGKVAWTVAQRQLLDNAPVK